LAFGISGALFRRERTGEPSVVAVSLLATAMWTLAYDVISSLQGNFHAAPPSGDEGRFVSPNPLTSAYKTNDGRYISLMFLHSDRYWVDLCRAIDRPDLADDPRFADAGARAKNTRECTETLDEIFAARSFAQWRSVFDEESFPWAPYLTVPELIEDRQVVANGHLGEVAVDANSSFSMPTGAVQFDEQPAAMRRGPEQGQDTELLLLELGYDWDQIAALKESGTIM
jgi:crotonobetainyl-CoA:carnitine CoA-transferase CaiB-like acyl-CoA transferase